MPQSPRPCTPAGAPSRSRWARWRDGRPELSVESIALLASLFWLAAANRMFFAGALAGRELADPSAWGFGLALGTGLAALHFALLVLVGNRWTLKPVLALLIVASAIASFYMPRYGVFLDPSMVRNVLHTDPAEARELIFPALLPHLAWQALLPLALLWRVRIARTPPGRALGWRLASLVVALGVLLAAVLAVFQPLASLMRNQKELRYLITPANLLWSLAVVAGGDTREALGPRRPVGEDATLGPLWARPRKPMLVVLVVGETARAASWGLSGYARQTTPRLAKLPVINFREVESCGTNTEVSLPCMFAPVGRRDYDEGAIRRSESLLHVLSRAGVGVLWRDNQSGCKGVCEGLGQESMADLRPPELCDRDRCLDEALLGGLGPRLAAGRGPQLLVLHMLGNHGPSYFRRYPPSFARFQPACLHDDLRRCSTAEIVNAYDNALLYTDHVLAELIGRLASRAAQLDSALIYVSDHGESLGENGLYLHGLPFAIAPDVQKRVPMVMWLSEGFAAGRGLDADCLRRRAERPASHDHLFHTVLGLLDVRTRVHDRAWDLTQGCVAGP